MNVDYILVTVNRDCVLDTKSMVNNRSSKTVYEGCPLSSWTSLNLNKSSVIHIYALIMIKICILIKLNMNLRINSFMHFMVFSFYQGCP